MHSETMRLSSVALNDCLEYSAVYWLYTPPYYEIYRIDAWLTGRFKDIDGFEWEGVEAVIIDIETGNLEPVMWAPNFVGIVDTSRKCRYDLEQEDMIQQAIKLGKEEKIKRDTKNTAPLLDVKPGENRK